jgi:integrase
MASFRKRGRIWYYRFTDINGKRTELKGCTDRRETEAMAGDAEAEVSKLKSGYIDIKDKYARDHEARRLVGHVADWQADLVAQGHTAKHAEHTSNRVRRLVAIVFGSPAALIDHRNLKPAERGSVAQKIATAIAPARFSDLTRPKIQEAIAKLRDSGWSLQTCNHYRASVKAFSKWCYATNRTKEDKLYGVKGYNAKEDPRHDRRTISLDELILLIGTAARGPTVMGVSGLARSLCYRLAATTGLRYSEISSIFPGSFDWEAQSVTVAACYTKNGDTASLPIPKDLLADLAAYVAPLNPKMPVFSLPPNKGAKMLRRDLMAAGIPYEDASGLFFDFHSLRCEMATLADAAGISPRIVQRLMRHSTLELTGRYTRPRTVDIDAAATMLPRLRPAAENAESPAVTGTDGQPISERFAPHLPRAGDRTVRFDPHEDVITDSNNPAAMKGLSLQKPASDACVRLEAEVVIEEAPPGFEPGMKVLQTSALPLGYGARKR